MSYAIQICPKCGLGFPNELYKRHADVCKGPIFDEPVESMTDGEIEEFDRNLWKD